MARPKRGAKSKRRHHHHRQHTSHEEKTVEHDKSRRASCCKSDATLAPEQSPRPPPQDGNMPDTPSHVAQLNNSAHRWRSAVSMRPASTTGGEEPATCNDRLDSLLEGLTGSDLRTATLVVQALRAPEDLSRLRRLAVTHGFVNDRIRAVVWPLLLGISPPGAVRLALGCTPFLSLSYGSEASQQRTVGPAAQQAPLAQAYGCQQDRPVSLRVTPPLPHSDLSVPGPLEVLSASCPISPTCAPEAIAAACAPGSAAAGDEADAASSSSFFSGQLPGPAARRCSGSHRGDGAASRQALPLALKRWGSSARISLEANGNVSASKEELEQGSPSRPGGETAGRPPSSLSASGQQPPGGGSALGRCDGDSYEQLCNGVGKAYDVPADVSHRRDEGCGHRSCNRHNGIRVSDRGNNGGSLACSSLELTPGPKNGSDGADWGWGSEGGGNSFLDGPCTVGAGCERESDWRNYIRWSEQPHRDSSVVEVDVARSLWSFTRGLRDEEREVRRRQLKRLLNALVAAHPGDLFYYQGLHDIAGVLLLSLPGPAGHRTSCSGQDALAAAHAAGAPCSYRAPAPAAGLWQCSGSHRAAAPSYAAVDGATMTANANTTPTLTGDGCIDTAGELLAFAVLRCLATTHLRDATRPSLEPVVQLLGLLPYLVCAADPALGRHLAEMGLQPFYALSWFLTWWAHELDDLPPASRLFDFFLASHPLMPLYLGAVAMRSQRARLLACEDMPELHSALANMKLVRPPSAAGGGSGDGGRVGSMAVVAGLKLDELLCQAERLWRTRPPHTLVPLRPTRGPPEVPVSPPPKHQQLRRRRDGSGGGGGVRDAGLEAGLGLVLTACVAHAARIEGRPAVWRVPLEPPANWPEAEVALAVEGRSGLAGIFSRASSAFGGRPRTAFLSTALLAGVYVAAAVAIGYATLARNTGGQQ